MSKWLMNTKKTMRSDFRTPVRGAFVLRFTMQRLSQTIKEAIAVAANLVNGEIGLAVLPGSSTGYILRIDAPGELLAAVADATGTVSQCSNAFGDTGLILQNRDTEVEDRRVDIWWLLDISVALLHPRLLTRSSFIVDRGWAWIMSIYYTGVLHTFYADYPPPLRMIPAGFQVRSASLVVQLSISA